MDYENPTMFGASDDDAPRKPAIQGDPADLPGRGLLEISLTDSSNRAKGQR
jgi:hypothetical protein